MSNSTVLGLLALAAFAMPIGASAASHDDAFATKAGYAGAAEVKLGKMAVQKSSNPAVRDFGQKMIDDHTAAHAKLIEAASGSSINIPDEPNSMQSATATELDSMSGDDFDKRFAEIMVQDHEEAVALFAVQAKSGKDSALKKFAKETLPTLKSHLAMAKSLDSTP